MFMAPRTKAKHRSEEGILLIKQTQYEKGKELSSGILKSTHNGAVLCCAALEVKLRKEKGARGNLVGSQEDS